MSRNNKYKINKYKNSRLSVQQINNNLKNKLILLKIYLSKLLNKINKTKHN